MLAASSLSVEIWQRILRYAISVPGFLDPSSFEGALSDFALTSPQFDRNNEAAYWRVERHRNAFQRVCKSWDMYLRPFEHRYVRMVDIWHNTIPFAVIEKAIRLTFESCGCKRRHFWQLTGHVDHQEDLNNYIVQRGGEYVQSGGQDIHSAYSESFVSLERLEIVDMKTYECVEDAFSRLTGHAKHVKTILARDCTSYINISYPGYVPAMFPQLSHYYARGCYWKDNADNPNDPGVINFNGETLSLIQNYQHVPSSPPLAWNHPNLRYLRIDSICFLGVAPLVGDVYPLLDASGGNLHTLHLNCTLPSAQIPAQLWDWCPKLERIATNMMLLVPPMISHPFHTFISTPESLSRSDAGFLDWPNLRIITVDWIWNNTLTEAHIPSQWRKKYSDKVIRIEDQNGLTWRESVELASRPEASILKLVTGPFVPRAQFI